MHDILQRMRIDLETRKLTEDTVSTYLRYAGKQQRDLRRHPGTGSHAAPIVTSVEQRGRVTHLARRVADRR